MNKIIIPVILITLLASNLGCTRSPKTASQSEPANDTITEFELSVDGEAVHTIVVGSTVTVDPILHPLMLGVISGPQISDGSDAVDVTQQYQDIGVTAVRNNDYGDDRLDIEGIFNCGGDTYPSWEGCDANDDKNYNWTKSDAQYQAWIDGGFIPFLRIGGEMKNNLNPHDFNGPQNDTQEDNWIIAANKMVDRYKNWNGKASAFTYVDIWTEIPGNAFWDRSDADFIKFWVKAYKSINATHPDLKIGGPGFIGIKLLEDKDRLATGILSELYKQGIQLDWLGWHTFGTNLSRYSELANAYQELLDGDGEAWANTGYFSNTEVITDAYGNGSGNAPVGGEEKISVNTGRGAAVLTSGWISLQYANIQGAFYYRGNDYGATKQKKGTSVGDSDNQAGLFTASGEYKPLSHAFKLWSTITNNYPTLLSTNMPVDGSNPDIWVMAAKNSEGKIALLVANPSTNDTTFTIQADGKELSTFSTAIVYKVDDNNDGTSASTLTTASISLPAGAVELIKLMP